MDDATQDIQEDEDDLGDRDWFAVLVKNKQNYVGDDHCGRRLIEMFGPPNISDTGKELEPDTGKEAMRRYYEGVCLSLPEAERVTRFEWFEHARVKAWAREEGYKRYAMWSIRRLIAEAEEQLFRERDKEKHSALLKTINDYYDQLRIQSGRMKPWSIYKPRKP